MCDGKHFGYEGRCKGKTKAYRFVKPIDSPSWVYIQLCETHQPKGESYE